MSAVIISGLWGMGAGVIIFLAAMQGISPELYEASELDGAGLWSQFLNVTVPMLSPVILYNLLIGMIGALQTFARIYVMTARRPELRVVLLQSVSLRQCLQLLQTRPGLRSGVDSLRRDHAPDLHRTAHVRALGILFGRR